MFLDTIKDEDQPHLFLCTEKIATACDKIRKSVTCGRGMFAVSSVMIIFPDGPEEYVRS